MRRICSGVMGGSGMLPECLGGVEGLAVSAMANVALGIVAVAVLIERSSWVCDVLHTGRIEVTATYPLSSAESQSLHKV